MNLDQIRLTAIQTSSSSLPIKEAPKQSLKKIDNDLKISFKTSQSDKLRNYKFCSVCGHQMLGFLKSLTGHFKAQHPNTKIENASFLKNGQLPLECKYSNWAEYLNNPYNVQLNLNKDHFINSGGKKVSVLPERAPQKRKFLKKGEKCPNELYYKQIDLQINPEKYKNQFKLRKRQVVLKAWHLYRVETLKKQRDLAFADKYDKIPDEFYTRRVREKMAEMEDQIVNLKDYIKKFKKKETVLKNEKQKLQDEINSLNKTIRQQDTQKQELQDNISNLNAKVLTLEGQIKFFSSDEKQILEEYEQIKIQLDLDYESKYKNQLDEALLNFQTEQLVTKDLTAQVHKLVQDVSNVTFSKNQAILKQNELQQSLDFYKKDLNKNQTQNDLRAEELQKVREEFQEYIALYRDLNDDYHKNIRLQEIEDNVMKDSYIRNIVKQVAKNKKQTKKQINELQNKYDELKKSKFEIWKDKLYEFEESIYQEISKVIDKEESIYYSMEQNKQLIKSLKSLRDFVVLLGSQFRIKPFYSSDGQISEMMD